MRNPIANLAEAFAEGITSCECSEASEFSLLQQEENRGAGSAEYRLDPLLEGC